MTDKINELLRRVEEFKPKAAAEIEEFRIKVLGKKGELNALMEEFKTVAPELKREMVRLVTISSTWVRKKQ